ncbi:iron-sulfur cluster assembly 1, mitochondrial [Acrasis kona]|uniref:Iron-sulfur cluster assembly 1, mitochondrial n=1 Tax=Acrasis kona TaxID=1008807 RepID=A0AAW2YZB9_9EUKA
MFQTSRNLSSYRLLYMIRGTCFRTYTNAAPLNTTLTNSTIPRPRRAVKAPISITEAAAQQINRLMSKNKESVGIKLGVKRKGCNGLSYTMDYSSEKPKFFEEVDEKGVKVFIDPKALMYVVGTTMDYIENEISSEFTFNNPNAKSKCGCGESFNV